MNPAEWLARAARLWPDAPALMSGLDTVCDYSEFARRAAAIGQALVEDHGVRPGDRVGLFMTNRTEYLEAFYGALWAGATTVPVNAKLHPKECAWILENSDTALLFVSDDVGAKLGSDVPSCVRAVISVEQPGFTAMRDGDAMPAPHAMTQDDVVWLFYTSGTTGRPKGVMLTAGNLNAMSLGYFADVDDVSHEDAIFYAAPMSHGAGLYNFMHVLRGARHVAPPSGGFEPDEIIDLAKQLRNVSMFAAPTMVRRLVDRARLRGEKGDGIKTIVYGGGPMYLADILDAVEVMGPRFVQIYGQGESPMAITSLSRALVADRSHPRWRQRLASIGIAQSSVEVRIVGADGAQLAPGEVGEIIARGPTVMKGYWRNPQATADTVKDGWLWTGDMGAMDEDGFVTMHDRSKDMIISGGTNIYPREVEETLLTHPTVHEASVVGRPHADWGEEVIAFVVAAPGAEIDPASLDAHCRENIARFKRPKDYRVVEALPKNNYGKVLKTELRERLKAESG